MFLEKLERERTETSLSFFSINNSFGFQDDRL
jgi:hypothetical protein